MSKEVQEKLLEYRKSKKLERPDVTTKRQQTTSGLTTAGLLFGFLQPIETHILRPVRPIFQNWLRSSDVDIRKLETWLGLMLAFILGWIFKNIGLLLPYSISISVYAIWRFGFSQRRSGEVSAYNVFNKNFERLQGEFTAEKFEKQMRRGI